MLAGTGVLDNTQSREGDSPWHKRHDKGKFKGKRIPFGSLVDFMPSPIRGTMPKFAPRTQPGLFLGYFLLPGGRWKGDILVASLEDLRQTLDDPNARISVHRVKEVTREANQAVTFPFRAIHERSRASVVDPSDRQLFAEGDEQHDAGQSVVPSDGPWDPPPVIAEVLPEPVVEPAPPMVEEDPDVPRLPPNVERAKGGYLIGGRFVRD